MAQLRIGGPVPGRKRRLNPETITGRPMIGTFQGLGMPSTVKAIQVSRPRGELPIAYGTSGKVRLPKGHLCHKVHPKVDIERAAMRYHYEHARTLSLLLDRLGAEHVAYDTMLARFNGHVGELIYRRQYHHLNALVEMEAKRGQVRTSVCMRRS